MKRIGRYEVQAELGRGGFGQVFRAHDPTVGRAVAIKVLQAAEEPELLLRFRSEAAAAGKLRHRNIITIYDFGEQDHIPYLVMEYLEGEDLEKIIAHRRPLTLLQKLDIMAQTASGLHHAHQQGIVHRDIKPANLMLLADGTVKVMDFGIALLSQATAARITPQGSLIGTFPYMSPEQFYGAVSDSLTDLFAYGVTCYKLLTGIHPFHAPEMAGMMHNIMNKRPAPIRAFLPECPEALEDAVFKMLAKEREARYQSLEDVKFDLEPIISELGKERVDELVREAGALIDSGEFDSAHPLVREALEIDAGNRTARELRERLQRLIKERAVRPQIAALLDAGRHEMEAQHYDEAIKKFESALRLDRSNREIQELIQKARADWERQQRADRLVTEARQALNAGELTAANKGISDALSAFPEHSTAKALLADIRNKLETRQREGLLRDGISRARGLMLLQSFDAAVGFLTQLRTEFPESPELARLLADATLERDAKIRQDRLRAGTEEIKELIKNRQFSEATSLASRLSAEFPESKEIADLGSYAAEEDRALKRAAIVAQLTADTANLIEAGQFDEAISRLKRALDDHPSSSSLRELLQSVTSSKSEKVRKEALDRARARAAELIARGAYARALDCLASFTTAYGDSAELDRLRRSAEEELEKQRRIASIRKLVLQAQGLIDEGRADTASQVLQQATVQFPEDSDVTRLLTVAQDQLREQRRAQEISNTIAEAESLARSKQFDTALKVLDEAIPRNPSESRLARCKEAIVAAKNAYEQEQIRAEVKGKVTALRREGQFEAALNVLGSSPAEFLAKDPEFARLRTQIEADLQEKRRKEEIQRTVVQAQELISQGDLQSATRILERAASEHPSHAEVTRLFGILDEQKRAQERARDRAEKISRIQARVRELLERNAEEQAVEVLRQALKDYPDEREFPRLLETAEAAASDRRKQRAIAAAIAEASELVRRNQLAQALLCVETALNEFPGDESLKSLREKIRSRQFVASAVSRAEDLRVARELEAAVAIIQEGLRELPHEPKLLDALNGVQAEIAARDRNDALAKALENARSLLGAKRYSEALASLHEASERFPDAPGVSELLKRAEHELRDERINREVEGILLQADGYFRRGQLDKALDALENAPASTPAVRDMLNRTREALKEKHRDESVAEALALCEQSRFEDALATLQRGVLQYGSSREASALRERLEKELEQQRKRDTRGRDLASLLALQREIAGASSRRRLRRAQQEINGWLAAYPEDAEIAEIGKRLTGQIETRLVPKPGRWNIPAAVLLAFLCGTALWLAPRFLHKGKEPVPVEVRTDPPGASVKLGNRSCVTPNCRFEIEPGEYSLEASLQGYQNLKRSVTVYTGKERHFMDLVLEPLPPPPSPVPASQTGTLTVKTGQARTLIFVDNVAQKRTDDSGSTILELPTGMHSVRVAKPGFQAPGEQRIAITARDSGILSFNLIPQIAPSETSHPSKQIASPSFPPPATTGSSAAVLSSEAKEAADWQRAHSSGDQSLLRNFLASYPTSSHASDAQAQIDDLDWSRVNTSDTQSLNTYLSQYPNGRHAREATLKIAELDWENLDKGNEDAIRAYVIAHPNSTYRGQAEGLIGEIESRKAAAARAANEPAVKGQSNPQLQGESFAIDSALAQFNQAFQRKQPRDVKKIWPSVPAEYTDAMRLSGASFVMNLHPVDAAEINGETASIRCDLLITRTLRGKADQTHKSVKVRLQKVNGAWSILDPLGS